ncbi:MULTISPECIES: spore coat associated protein CotJA [Clostridium]|uniref:Spore coat associated protein JA (CotJA) n=4 Tax=Clostridium TaxID=1485 RepID=D8GRL8_CLOLD|nr:MULTISPECIES: spore coat associated protein CotJA [Clostridium]ADK16386.1 conserved hypothetical protein [Clostridium ljungdahlii DSM 13528]AGY75465.1 spore coat associated protein CotJA [Clostridium autoethanogenum DSM 10061]ALU35631.1 Spore coat protein CotJA [Clostridium autoethanogenum DSM 10061]OAA89738.1 Spore coat associated protein JA (CotJA) [Clostridium ljungdahlii DSM 13528]OAA94630.1 Spore coat associated protein JA (CotJA) [Clostridium coskatii]
MYSKFVPHVNSRSMPSAGFPHNSGKKLARAYVPMQPYIGLLPLNMALKKGTIFPNLVMPFPENED